jgi:hypothetical protein
LPAVVSRSETPLPSIPVVRPAVVPGELYAPEADDVLELSFFWEARAMGGGSWLFVKELRSTWIERPRRHVLRIAGPGAVLDRREFTTVDELEEFLSSLTDRLVAEGWILAQIDYDRRRRAPPASSNCCGPPW